MFGARRNRPRPRSNPGGTSLRWVHVKRVEPALGASHLFQTPYSKRLKASTPTCAKTRNATPLGPITFRLSLQLLPAPLLELLELLVLLHLIPEAL
jgi:hypothetical protein